MSELTQDRKTPIQSYGTLICTDAFDHIVGISSAIQEMFSRSAEQYLGRDIRDLLTNYFADQSAYILSIVREIKHQEIANKVLEFTSNNQKYSLRLSQIKNNIHWEWELKTSDKPIAFQMDDIAHVLESSPKSLWHKLSENILHILRFDRVYVCQVYENGTSEVIAEHVEDVTKSLLHGRFSEDFLRQEDIRNYQAVNYRYVPDLFAPLSTFHQLAEEQVDVAHSHLYPIPLLHADLARSLGAKSLIAFPLIANGRLWGILMAHSFSGVEIDLQKRQLCQLLCMYAAKKQESNIKNTLLEFQENIHDTLLGIRNDLMSNTDIFTILSRHMSKMQQIPDADGIAICVAEEMHVLGIVPESKQILQIAKLIRNLKEKSLFLDSNFRLRYAHLIDGELNFAGIMALRLGKDSEMKIMWFRQEEIDMMYQTTPLCQQLSQEEHGIEDTLYAHETWQREVIDTAKSWNTNDLYFVEHLRSLLQDTMLAKSEEKERINQKLISLNNELEMLTFTLSHDLKNPLSVVKLSSQMLSRKLEGEHQRWIKILLDGVDDIESMVNSVLSVGKSRIYHFDHTDVPMGQMIEKIVSHSQLIQNSFCATVDYGNLHPIWGERNLLHQVFQNVIGNAIKYSKNHAAPKLHIHSYLTESETVYEIQDNGIGIPANELEHIFHVFRRSSNVGKIAGTGVGLALVRRIMDRLQAGINLQSSEQTGTKVILTFKKKPPIN
ncbi:ATP-binding protein [Sphingobacterium sp. lm-10]|uniref:ATP-binding protein n=1 Tax=Sphingobacterium sp. lm-10 TaxID=2944904 RepID=UPI0020203F76|nr:ATP-binding protein [Sphingobacterium sp. lm-10]MCL7987466.1 ATP-binding protein [Sphingobacterium sp. lm-10]